MFVLFDPKKPPLADFKDIVYRKCEGFAGAGLHFTVYRKAPLRNNPASFAFAFCNATFDHNINRRNSFFHVHRKERNILRHFSFRKEGVPISLRFLRLAFSTNYFNNGGSDFKFCIPRIYLR